MLSRRTRHRAHPPHNGPRQAHRLPGLRIYTLFGLLILWPLAAGADQASPGPRQAEPAAPRAHAAHLISLPALTADQAAAHLAAASEAAAGALRLGFGREIPAGTVPAAGGFRWQAIANGGRAPTLIVSLPRSDTVLCCSSISRSGSSTSFRVGSLS